MLGRQQVLPLKRNVFGRVDQFARYIIALLQQQPSFAPTSRPCPGHPPGSHDGGYRMIRGQHCKHRLHVAASQPHRRPGDQAPAYLPVPRHHRTSEQEASAARTACISRASAVEAASSSSAASALDVEPPADGPTAKLVVVMPAEGLSHFGIPWTRVMTQMARRLSWVDPAFQMQVCDPARQPHAKLS